MDKVILVLNTFLATTNLLILRRCKNIDKNVLTIRPDVEHIMEDLHRAAK